MAIYFVSHSDGGSNFFPPPMHLGAFETRWEEGPAEEDWHFEMLDSTNVGLPSEEQRRGAWGAIHEERWEKYFITIVEQRGRGLERALKDLAADARLAIEGGRTVPSVPISPLTAGIYVSSDGEYTRYLRFYADGGVVGVTASGTPEQVGLWLGREHAAVSKGTFSTTAHHIEFVARTESGAVSYKGILTSPTRLILDVYSHINGNVSRATEYEFVETAVGS